MAKGQRRRRRSRPDATARVGRRPSSGHGKASRGRHARVWQGGDLRFRAASGTAEMMLDGDSTAGPHRCRRSPSASPAAWRWTSSTSSGKGRHPVRRDRSAIHRRPRRRITRADSSRIGSISSLHGDVPGGRGRACDCALAREILLGLALAAPGHRVHDDVRGRALNARAAVVRATAYLDWLRGLAVVAMVLAHVIDSWTRDADRHDETLLHAALHRRHRVAAIPLSRGRRTASCRRRPRRARRAVIAPAPAPRAAAAGRSSSLALVFRLQAEILGLRPAVRRCSRSTCSTSWACRWSRRRGSGRSSARHAATGRGCSRWRRPPDRAGTPLVRARPWLAPLPDPLEAYLRPAGDYSGVSTVSVGRIPLRAACSSAIWSMPFASARRAGRITRVRSCARRSRVRCDLASRSPGWPRFDRRSIPTARFWHDSPTFFFIRLGLVTAWYRPVACGVGRRTVSPRCQRPSLLRWSRSAARRSSSTGSTSRWSTA